MRGRIWLVLGVALGIAVAAGGVPYLAGAGRSLSETAERLVGSGARRLISGAASTGAPRRVVLGFAGVIGVLVPGITAWLLVIAARGSLRLRVLIGLLIAALGAVSYVYHPAGDATGVLILALVVAALAIALTGPLVAAPLAGLAALIGATFLPELVSHGRTVTQASVDDLHQAIFGSPGTPALLQVVMLVIAALPFVLALRLVFRR